MHIDQSVLGVSIVLEARGGTAGTAGTAGARNTDYRSGLVTLLRLLASEDAVLADAYVDSDALSALPISLRRRDVEMPLPLEVSELATITRRMGRSMARVGRSWDAKGSGNSTRRIRLLIRDASRTDL